MPQVSLFIDTTANLLVQGQAGTTNSANISTTTVDPNSLPFFFGDTVNMQIYLLQRVYAAGVSGFTYGILNNTGLALFLYIDDGTITPGNIYTQQITWTPDSTNSYVSANLALNTTALSTLIGSTTSAQPWLKVGYVQSGLTTTVLSRQTTIGVGLPATSLVVPAGLTPLSLEVARATFFPLAPVAGQALYLESPAGKIFAGVATDLSDGTAKAGFEAVN